MKDKRPSGRGRKSVTADADDPATSEFICESVTGPVADGTYDLNMNGEKIGSLLAAKNKNTVISLIDGFTLTKSSEPFKLMQTVAQRDSGTDKSKHHSKDCRHWPNCIFGDACTFCHPLSSVIYVAIGVYNDKGFFLVGMNSSNAWCIPTGKVNPGENAPIAAVRELEEMTGLIIDASDLHYDFTDKWKCDKGIVYATLVYSCHKSACSKGKAVPEHKLGNMMYVEKSSKLMDYFDEPTLTGSIGLADNIKFSKKVDAAISKSDKDDAARREKILEKNAITCVELEKTMPVEGAPMSEISDAVEEVGEEPAHNSEVSDDAALIASPEKHALLTSPPIELTPEQEELVAKHKADMAASPQPKEAPPGRDDDTESRTSGDSINLRSPSDTPKVALSDPFRMLIARIAKMPNTTVGHDAAATTLRVTYTEDDDDGKARKGKSTRRFFFLKSSKQHQVVLICGKSKAPKCISLNEYTVATHGQVVAESRDMSKENATVLTPWENKMLDCIVTALRAF